MASPGGKHTQIHQSPVSTHRYKQIGLETKATGILKEKVPNLELVDSVWVRP